MECPVIEHPRYSLWFNAQSDELQDEIAANLIVLQEMGPSLGRPRVDTVKGSGFCNIKELRLQFRGFPYRILFAFDSMRQAVLLLGGCKRGDPRWYLKNIPVAERRFREYLEDLKEKAEQ